MLSHEAAAAGQEAASDEAEQLRAQAVGAVDAAIADRQGQHHGVHRRLARARTLGSSTVDRLGSSATRLDMQRPTPRSTCLDLHRTLASDNLMATPGPHMTLTKLCIFFV